ncbi:MAG: type III pantothenate kinase [Sphingomonadales bacterium]
MLLAIDAGNTNIVFAVHDGRNLRGQWRAATDDTRTADEYFVWLNQLFTLEGLSPSDIDGAIIASVAPQALFNLRSLCRRYFNCPPIVVGDNGADLGIKVRVDQPGDVGADRLVNAVAAHECYDGPLILIDFGTATTFDVVDADGSYLGGIIAPGINLSLEALNRAAAKLPLVAIQRPKQVIGKATISAMQSGAYWGYVSLIEGLVGRIKDEYGADMTVIATGGLASLFGREMDLIEHIDKDLTIRGLVAIHRRNSAS